MDVIGIICEYNPFHNGHIYHINKIRSLYKDATIILILNGYFLQRGEISILTKEDKVKIALQNKVDLVVELPFLYGSQSADVFAQSALEILNALKINKLVFGSESNNLEILEKVVDMQLHDSTYNDKVKKYLKDGLNYPSAMAKALEISFDINHPNDLLAISYLKAIKINHYEIEPISIKRTSDYHDTKSTKSVVSASNIRKKILQKEDISSYLPKAASEKIIDISYDKYFSFLKYKIITEPHLEKYLTVDEGIENKLKKVIQKVSNLEELIEKVKTRRYTYNKLNRMFIHILVGVLKTDCKAKIDYIKILGFNLKGKKYLSSIKKDMILPLQINTHSSLYSYELKASLIYDLITNLNTYTFEIKNKPVQIK